MRGIGVFWGLDKKKAGLRSQVSGKAVPAWFVVALAAFADRNVRATLIADGRGRPSLHRKLAKGADNPVQQSQIALH